MLKDKDRQCGLAKLIRPDLVSITVQTINSREKHVSLQP